MATVESTLVTLIETNTNYKCYPLTKPQTVSVPVVVYERLSTTKQRIHNGNSTFNRVRLALSIYGSTYSSVKTASSTISSLFVQSGHIYLYYMSSYCASFFFKNAFILIFTFFINA